MKETVLQAALAGLLHDIGKIEQRARDDPWKPAQGTEGSGQPVHATWSIQFTESYVHQPHRRWAIMGAYHHNPERLPAEEKRISWVVALADKLSAGERADLEDQEKKHPMQMVSIFDQIKLGDKVRQGDWHYLPLEPLGLKEENLFPARQEKVTQAYEGLRNSLQNAAKEKIDDLPTYLEHMLSALQQYAWSVPSAYYHSIPDISLYDHSRMTAALAACLAEWEEEEIQALLKAVNADFQGTATEKQREHLDSPVALLIGGDISGIQDFIYTISSKGAARMLRGRSFYLQLLTEAVLRFVLEELGLPYCNVIYTGGGHFFLLAPIKALSEMERIRRQVTKKLIAHHATGLYLALGSAQVPASGFRPGKFPQYWGQMHQALAQAKQRKYAELGEQMYSTIFKPAEFGGNPEDVCDVCGEDQRKVVLWDKEQGIRICSLCRSFHDELGKELPKTRFLALGTAPCEDGKAENALGALAAFGLKVQLLKSEKDKIYLPQARRAVIWALDDPPGGKWPQTDQLPTARYLRYTVNQIPEENGNPQTFEDLQKKTEGGFERLGVLRMDVDDLGELFTHGLGEKATLARLAALSFQIGLFFEGWTKPLIEAKEYEKLIYAVYAGGDDLFLIGPWDRIPPLAAEIQAEFKRYTSHHPALHISGGMAFIDDKYPVYQAADDAAGALGQAKKAEGKNAFSFLGEAWKWEAFAELSAKKERLVKLVTDKNDGLGGPQAILQVLQQLAREEARAAQERGRPVWGPWMWLGAYQLTRMREQYQKNKPEVEKELQLIQQELSENNYQEIHPWGVAARWAQLLTRKKKEKKENG